MLKRTVVIGVLLMLALALTAFGPDAPQPPDVPAQGELEVEIDGWTTLVVGEGAAVRPAS